MPAFSKAATNARRAESVSTVEPDLDDTTRAVLSRSCNANCTISGSVESSTNSSTPSERVMTSGAREEPPMPASTNRVTPSDAKSSRNCRISATRGRDTVAASVQPRRILASSSAAGPHRVGSLSKSLDANCSSTKPGTLDSMA